jgi:folate-binding protein YgfZ
VNAAEQAAAVRRGVGWVALPDRALLAITGDDRVRWLDGMLTQDVTNLQVGQGCYAALLTHQGRIVGDMNVLAREDAFWLEMAADAAPAVCEKFEKHIIADDVAVVEVGPATERIALEGPEALRLFEELAGRPAPDTDAWAEVRVSDALVNAIRVDVTGTPGLRCINPLGSGEALTAAFAAAARESGIEGLSAVPEALEILRIEAGTPAFGAELDDSVLPAEARLDRAISTTKGCYVGQEVVARMQSAGRSSHLLMGVRFDAPPPAPGAEVRVEGAKRGELTSACLSPHVGAIGLAYLRSAHAQPGTEVVVGEVAGRLCALPLFAPNFESA